jgi:predicted phosphodiesterase
MRQRVYFAWIIAAVACLAPAEERTALDDAVGHLRTTAVTLDVVGGLATVKETKPGSYRLWAQAPVLELRLEVPVTGTVDLDFSNVLADARLSIDGRAPVAPGASQLPTRQSYRLDLLAAGTHRLTLAPDDAAARGAFRFALLSDVQEAIDRVGDIFARMAADPSLRFVLSAGDLTDRGKQDELVRFQNELEALPVPFYATCGNHDIGTSEVLFREVFGRGNLHFVYRGVHFTLLDSASATVDAGAYAHLDGWLAEGRPYVHVVAMHIPPLDPVGGRNAAFASRDEAAALLEKLAAGRVDLTLYGHIHSYYAFENAGIPAVISGGGGAHPERMDGIGRHYVVVTLDDTRVMGTELVRVDNGP